MTTYLDLDMHSKKITNLGTPSSGDDVIDVTYADNKYLGKSAGGTVSGDIDFYGTVTFYSNVNLGTSSSNRHRILYLAEPVFAYDAATKNYVDTHTYTSFRNWVADDTLDMDWEDIINVWDLEIDGNNLWLDGTDIENAGDITADSDSNYDIGETGVRFANIYADDLWGTTHDLEWAERICPICKNKFKEGEFLIQVVSGVGVTILGRKHNVTRTVPVHLNCVNNLHLKEEKQQKEDIKKMMGQITILRKELLELKRQRDDERKKRKEEKRKLKQAKRED